MRPALSSIADRLYIGSLAVHIPYPRDPHLPQPAAREQAMQEATRLASLLAAAPRMRELLDRACRALEDAAALLPPEALDCSGCQAEAWTIRAAIDQLPPCDDAG
jgi:hypothetical protein